MNFVPNVSGEAEYREHVEAKRREDRRKAIEAAGIEPRFRNATFGNYKVSTPQQRAILRAVEEYADLFGPDRTPSCSLVMLGKPGTGKTHLANALCLSVIEKNLIAETPCYWSGTRLANYMQASDIFRCIKGTFHRDATRTEAEILDRFNGRGLLVIDEVAFTPGSEFEARVMFEVIDRRYRNECPTVLISNGDARSLSACLGERAWDRLTAVGNQVLMFDWPSHRQQSMKGDTLQ